ncbi:MAG: L-2-hydroxyglutarate oxidase [Acidobacteriota bacterium]|nr:L-2-hydroxyglutarate oxidase [Acidobacteriota bacterium]
MLPRVQVAIVGGGLVGLATARALVAAGRRKVVVLEAESEVARHQSGRNSGVLHSGIYYSPGSLKAQLCAEGRNELQSFCESRGIAFRRCGKLIVACEDDELARLEGLEWRARANGLTGVRRLGVEQMRELEPHVRGVAGLHVPETGVIDFAEVTRELATAVRECGSEVVTGSRVLGVVSEDGGLVVETEGNPIRALQVINCAGLQSDRVARLCGLEPSVRIVPFRGLYYRLVSESARLVRALIYPVPDPRLPFLGVHLTRTIDGKVKAGPNAVLALAREGYRLWSFSVRDTVAVLAYAGFWRMAARWWRTGVGEVARSMSRSGYAASLRRMVPEVRTADLKPLRGGIRAQAVDARGGLVDDFHIEHGDRSIHVLNAPSPAGTASLAIGRRIAELAKRRLA